MSGKGNKNQNRKITAYKAYYIMLDTFIKYDRLQIMTISVANIKSLLSKTPVNMQEIIQGASDEINTTDTEQMDIDNANKQQEEMQELSLQDI